MAWYSYQQADAIDDLDIEHGEEMGGELAGCVFDGEVLLVVTHDGDEDFTRQVESAVKREQEGGFTLSKRKSAMHIDAAVALCMGVYALDELAPVIDPPLKCGSACKCERGSRDLPTNSAIKWLTGPVRPRMQRIMALQIRRPGRPALLRSMASIR